MASENQPKQAAKGPTSTKVRLYDDDGIRRRVEVAKQRAVATGRPEIAERVHEVWMQSCVNEHLADLLERMLSQTATAAQENEFQQYVRAATEHVKRVKAAKKAAAEKAAAERAAQLAQPSEDSSGTQ